MHSVGAGRPNRTQEGAAHAAVVDIGRVGDREPRTRGAEPVPSVRGDRRMTAQTQVGATMANEAREAQDRTPTPDVPVRRLRTGPIVITGASGQIGTSVQAHLTAFPNEIRAIGRGDDLVGACRDAAAVVHLAGTLQPHNSETFSEANVGTVLGTVGVLTGSSVERIVFLSFTSASAESKNEYLRDKARGGGDHHRVRRPLGDLPLQPRVRTAGRTRPDGIRVPRQARVRADPGQRAPAARADLPRRRRRRARLRRARRRHPHRHVPARGAGDDDRGRLRPQARRRPLSGSAGPRSRSPACWATQCPSSARRSSTSCSRTSTRRSRRSRPASHFGVTLHTVADVWGVAGASAAKERPRRGRTLLA